MLISIGALWFCVSLLSFGSHHIEFDPFPAFSIEYLDVKAIDGSQLYNETFYSMMFVTLNAF